LSDITTRRIFMPLAGALAVAWKETTQDNSVSSCDGKERGSPERRHYKIHQIVVCQTTDFRWKVAVFSRDRCELVGVFSNPDAMSVWLNDVSRLHTWTLIDPVGLD
jgi:hypothetical protein